MTDKPEPDAIRAAELIAALYYADTNIELDPFQVRSFIKMRWARIAPLAHAIHGQPDDTKLPVQAPLTEAQRIERAVIDLQVLIAKTSMNSLNGVTSDEREAA